MYSTRRGNRARRTLASAVMAVVVLLATSCSDRGKDANPVLTFNELLAEDIVTWSTDTSDVVLVDHWTWFDPETHSLDGIHPNPLGEKEMATRWVKAVQREVGTPAEPLRVLPLGDSITDDYTRYDTWKGLVEAGYAVDFVGTQTSIPSSRNGEVPDVNGQTFDQDHEGHSAWAASDMLAGRPKEPDAGRLELWLEQTAEADVVLLHIGTNDIGRLLTEPELVVDRTSRIVFQLQQAMPDATILVAQITPLGSEK